MTPLPALRLTSLAAIKRALPVGARLQVVASEAPHLKVGQIRTVAVVQTNAIALRGAWANGGREWLPDRLSWLYWPKAAEITLHGDDTFTVGRWSSRYRVLP